MLGQGHPLQRDMNQKPVSLRFLRTQHRDTAREQRCLQVDWVVWGMLGMVTQRDENRRGREDGLRGTSHPGGVLTESRAHYSGLLAWYLVPSPFSRAREKLPGLVGDPCGGVRKLLLFLKTVLPPSGKIGDLGHYTEGREGMCLAHSRPGF